MGNSIAFDWLADELEAATSLDRLEARGTLRLALKSGGLEASKVSADELKVVLDRILPGELQARGIENAEALCRNLSARIDGVGGDASQPDTPADVFARLG